MTATVTEDQGIFRVDGGDGTPPRVFTDQGAADKYAQDVNARQEQITTLGVKAAPAVEGESAPAVEGEDGAVPEGEVPPAPPHYGGIPLSQENEMVPLATPDASGRLYYGGMPIDQQHFDETSLTAQGVTMEAVGGPAIAKSDLDGDDGDPAPADAPPPEPYPPPQPAGEPAPPPPPPPQPQP